MQLDMNPIENIWNLFETFMRTFQKHFKKKILKIRLIKSKNKK